MLFSLSSLLLLQANVTDLVVVLVVWNRLLSIQLSFTTKDDKREKRTVYSSQLFPCFPFHAVPRWNSACLVLSCLFTWSHVTLKTTNSNWNKTDFLNFKCTLESCAPVSFRGGDYNNQGLEGLSFLLGAVILYLNTALLNWWASVHHLTGRMISLFICPGFWWFTEILHKNKKNKHQIEMHFQTSSDTVTKLMLPQWYKTVCFFICHIRQNPNAGHDILCIYFILNYHFILLYSRNKWYYPLEFGKNFGLW